MKEGWNGTASFEKTQKDLGRDSFPIIEWQAPGFNISIPRVKEKNSVQTYPSRQNGKSHYPPDVSSRITASMISVLYVDDEPGLLEIGQLYLERKGEFRVETAISAKDALEIIQRGKYDAIISDYQMPGMNGIDFLRQVRSSGNSIPFIIFTGRGREEVVIQALNEGADFYLQKGGELGSQFAELAHKVRQAVQQRQAEASIRDHERREADILNFLPDATFAIDTKGIVIAWNRAIEKMTGVRADVIVGKGNYEYAIPFYQERRPILIDLVLSEDPVTAAKYPDIKKEGKKLISEITIPHFNDGQGAALWFTASPLYNTSGEVVGAIESIREITERKKVEEALNESERRFRELAELLPQVIYEADASGKVTYANRIAFEAFGYSDTDLAKGLNAMEMIAPEDRQRAALAFRQMLEKGSREQGTREYRALRIDGSTFPVSIYSSPVLREGKIVGIRGIIIDITDRIQAEERVRESEQNYRVLFENATEGILIAQGDRMVHVNSALINLLERPVDVVTSRPFTDFIHPDDRDMVMSRHLQRMSGGIPPTGYMFRIIKEDGEEKWVWINSTRFTWSGKPASLSFLTDMTEQKKAEQSLVSANEEYTNLLNQIQDVYYRADAEGRLIRASRSWATLLGYDDLSECIGRNIADDFYVNPADRKQLLEKIYRDGKVTNYQVLLKRKDGTPVPVEASNHLYYDAAGNILGIEGIFRDITERKMQESILHTQLDLGLALQKAQGMQESMKACLDAAIEISGMDSGGIYFLDEENGSLDLIFSRNLGDAFIESVSHHPPGSACTNIVMAGTPLYIPCSELECLHSPAQQQEGLQSLAIIPITSGGRSIACMNLGSHTRREVPETARVALETIATQIEAAIERIRAQGALAESEQRYRNIVEDQTEFISRSLPDGTHLFVNDAYCRYFGFTREEMLGHRFKPVIPPEDLERLKRFFKSLTPEHPVDTIRHRIIMPDGTIRWQHWSDRAIFDAEGTLIEYQSVGRDITDVKEAEQALYEKESLYRSLSEVSPDIIFMIDRDDRVVYVNNAAAAMLGRSVQEVVGSERSSLFPVNLSMQQRAAIEQVFKTGTLFRSTGQINMGGTPRWFDHSLIPVRDESGNIIRVLGISHDITKQKNAVDALRMRTEELDTQNRVVNTLLDTVPIGIFMVDALTGKPIIANREAITLLGRGILPDSTEGTIAEMYEVYKAGTSTRYPADELPIIRGMKGETSHVDDMVVVRPDGTQVDLEVFGTPVKDEQGNVIASLVSFVDITERKVAEDTIAKLAHFPEESPHPVFRFTLDGTQTYANSPGKDWLASVQEGTALQALDVIRSLIAETLDNGGRLCTEMKGGAGRIYHITAIRPDNEHYINMYISDITECKNAEQTIKETNAKINLLTSITRHDVANQVTLLQGYTQIALEKEADPVIADLLAKIDRAGAMIAKIVDFTRTYQEIGLHNPDWFSLGAMIEKIQPESIPITNTCSNTEIYADPMLGKVFFNLFDNSIRHGEHVTAISIRCEQDSDHLSVIYEDNGIGIPVDEKEKIFTRGFGNNTGLGLFLSREILGITKISINETGVYGKGARFEMHVPVGAYHNISCTIPE